MNSYFIGVFFKLLNCLIFPIMSLILVNLTNNIPVLQVFFLQLALGSLVSFVALKLLKIKNNFKLNLKELALYLARAILNLTALTLWLHSIKNIGINESTAIIYCGPLWLTIFAIIFLKEKMNLYLSIIFTINIFGLFIAIEPKFSLVSLSSMFSAFGAIIMWSLYELICKIQTKTQHYLQQTFIFMLLSAIILLPFITFNWQPMPISYWLDAIIIAILAVANITVIFIAYSFAPLTLLAPFSYARLIFTVLLSFLFLNEKPTLHLFIGSAIILGSNIALVFSKRFNQGNQ
jgi:drug/metabolite transporter (DMT)-like permease